MSIFKFDIKPDMDYKYNIRVKVGLATRPEVTQSVSQSVSFSDGVALHTQLSCGFYLYFHYSKDFDKRCLHNELKR